MILAVTGGRNFADGELVGKALDKVHRKHTVTLLIHGAATGADQLCAQWAKMHDVPDQPFPADWKGNGDAAGPIRNQAMMDAKPDALVAFRGNRGTQDMVKRAEKAGISVWRVSR